MRSRKKITKKTWGEWGFVSLILVYPILLFCIFYVYVNFNSFLLAFKSIDITGAETFVGLSNFKSFLTGIFSNGSLLATSGWNSLRMYFVNLVVSMPLYIIFAYFFFKKCFLHRTLRAIMMIPQILSGFIMSLLFKNFVANLPGIMASLGVENFPNLISNLHYTWGTMIFYMIWISFAYNMVVYPNAMNAINPEIIESAQVDGVDNMFSELWHIILPCIYPTLVTFLVSGFAGALMTAGPLVTFFMYEAHSSIYTLGYYYTVRTVTDTVGLGYPEMAAGGLLMTLVWAPLTYLVKTLLEKYGPSEDKAYAKN